MPDTLFDEEWPRAVAPGAMLDEIRAFDWSRTSAGAITRWPEPVRHAVRTMLVSASPIAILLGREGFVLYNEAMRAMFGSQYDGSLGRPIFDILPEAAAFYRRAIDEVLAGRAVRHADEPLRLSSDGARKTRWFRLSFTPIVGGAGPVFGVLLIVEETTDLVDARRELRLVREQLKLALGADDKTGAPGKVPGVVVDLTARNATRAVLAESRLRLETLTDAVPHIVWSTDGQGTFDYFNSRFHEFTGVPARQGGIDIWRFVHPQDLERVRQAWRASQATGAAFDVEYRFRHRSGDYRWMRAMAQPMRAANGRIARWYGTSTDIHDTKLLGIERELVSRELDHRIKNLFALVNGLIGISLREAPELGPVADDLRRRLGALHDAHRYIRIAPNGARAGCRTALKGLIAQLLEPYAPHGADGPSMRIEGDEDELDEGEVSAFAMVIHELATNSAKYGALGDAGGRLAIAISRCAATLRILWRESAPCIPAMPDKQGGFGSRLLKATIETQLRGEIRRRQQQGGLAIDMRFLRPQTLAATDARRDAPPPG